MLKTKFKEVLDHSSLKNNNGFFKKENNFMERIFEASKRCCKREDTKKEQQNNDVGEKENALWWKVGLPMVISRGKGSKTWDLKF